MGLAFFIGLILWGWMEFSAFIYIGGEIGALLTLLGIFVTAIVGLLLLKNQGRAVMANLKDQVTRGEAPMRSVADSISLLFGGILMLIPGYVTDAIGLVLFIPGIRTIAGFVLLKLFRNNARFTNFAAMGGGPFAPGHAPGHAPGQTRSNARSHPNDMGDDIIEGEFEERSDDKKPLPPGQN